MIEVTFFCPECQTLQPAWTHDTATLDDKPKTKDGYLILTCLKCEPPLVYQDLPPWLAALVAAREPESLHSIATRTSPIENMAQRHPELFTDLTDEEAARLAASCEVQ